MTQLVQPLFDGPIDIVGDLHGDLDALHHLMRHLRYDVNGVHSADRRLVFVGDLTDRGPDSPAVVRFVKGLIQSGRAQCVLGNHELNIMLGQHKFDNGWFFGEKFVDRTGREVEQHVVFDAFVRDELIEFFATLPLVLEHESARVVHACWQPEMVAMASEADDVIKFYEQHRYNINLGLAIRADLEPWQRDQRRQNLNPVRVLTSGLEIRAEQPFEASGILRHLKRAAWWVDYHDDEFCFFGHYSRPYPMRSPITRAICVDFGVAQRWVPKIPGESSPDMWRLAAVRFPELEFVFDNGDVEPIQIESDRFV